MDVQQPFYSSDLSDRAIEMHFSAFFIEENKASFRLQTAIERRFGFVVHEDRHFEFDMNQHFLYHRRLFVSQLMSRVTWSFNDDVASRYWTRQVNTCCESALTHLQASNHQTGLHRGFNIVIRICVHEVVPLAASAPDVNRSTPDVNRSTASAPDVNRSTASAPDVNRTLTQFKLTRLKYDGGRFRETDCAICLVEYETDGEELTLMPCSHSFHSACLGRWLERSRVCPLCRYSLDQGYSLDQERSQDFEVEWIN